MDRDIPDAVEARIADPDRKPGKLNLSNCGMRPADVPAVLARIGRLEPLGELWLNANPLGAAGASLVAACGSLRSLDMIGLAECDLGADGAAAVARSDVLSGITRLNLNGNGLGPEGLRAVAGSTELVRLKRLSVSWNDGLAEGAEAIAASRALGGLNELFINGNDIASEGLRLIARSRSLVRLQHLDAANNNVGPTGADHVAGSENLRTLHTLDLSSNDLCCDGLERLARSVTLTGITTLCIRNNGARDRGMIAVLGSPVCRGLRGLVASTNHMTVLALNALLGNTDQLVELYVDENDIGADGAIAVANTGALRNLLYLALSDNPIGPEGVGAIARGRSMPLLKHLSLGNNGEGRQGWEAWIHHRGFPNLERLNFVGTPDLTDRELEPILQGLLPGAPSGSGGSLKIAVIRGCTGLGLTDAELAVDDPAEILRAVRRKREAGASPLLEVKVAILGVGRVGKSSLAARLRGQPRYAGEITHDVDIAKVAAPALHPTVGCRLFDFGGQTYLFATHRFSLQGRRTCYVIVLDGGRPQDDDRNELRYWLRLVQHYAFTERTRAPIVVVLGRADEWELGAPRLSGDDVRRVASEVGIDGGLWTVDRYADPAVAPSAPPADPLGIADVRRALREAIDSMAYVFQSVDPGFGDALGWVEGRPFPGDAAHAFAASKHVDLARFRRACEVFGASDPGQWELWLAELRDLGAVHWVGDRDDVAWDNRHGVRDTVFNPAWVKTPAYLIVRKSPAEAGLSRAALLAFLDGEHEVERLRAPEARSLWGGTSWEAPDRERLLQLLVAYETLFEVRPTAAQGAVGYLVPDRLPERRVDAELTVVATVELGFRFLPPGTFGRLIAAWPARVADERLCRDQALLTHPRCPGVAALVTAAAYRDTLTIQLAGGGPADRERMVTLVCAAVENLVMPATVRNGPEADPTPPHLAREQGPRDRAQRTVRANVPKVVPSSPATGRAGDAAPQSDSVVLSGRQRFILIAMLELGAVDSDGREKASEIAAKALGPTAAADNVKRDMARLKEAGFIRTEHSRDGGSYLTQCGIERARKLQGRDEDDAH